MDSTTAISVMVIENDDDFRDLLNGIFERSELFDLQGSFASIEDFAYELVQHKPISQWIPRLMVVDVMSSSDPRIEGATFMNSLRSEGLQFATLLVSSMDFGALLRVLRKSHEHGWTSLQKTSRLSELEVLAAAVSVCQEMPTT